MAAAPRFASCRRRAARLNVQPFPMADVHHENVFFIGRVQGVGFRYTALQVCREFEVSGYVANLPDGRVQLEVEGEKAVVEAFLTSLQARMHGYIRKLERNGGLRPAQFQGFTLR